MKRRIASILMSTVLLLNTMPLSAAPVAGDPAEGAVLSSAVMEQGLILEQELPTGGFTPAEVIELTEQEAKEADEAFARDMAQAGEESISSEGAIPSFATDELDEVFNRGAGTYGRSQLSAAQQAFYDDLDEAATTFMISGMDVTGAYASEGINYTKYGLSEEDAIHAFVAFDYDHPAYYWLEGLSYSNTSLYLRLADEFADADVRDVRNKQIISGVKRMAQKAAQGTTDFEKILIVADELMEASDYAYVIDPNTGLETSTAVSEKWAHSPIGIFDESLAHTVCEGYADSFALLMNYLSIPNVYITGLGDGGGHAWNAVSYDGGQTYCYMDITWDDQGHDASTGKANPSLYKWFGMPRTEFHVKHQAYTTAGTGLRWQYDLPDTITDDMDHTYFYMTGHYVNASTANLSSYVQNLKDNMIGNGRFFAILTDNENTFFGLQSSFEGSGLYYPTSIKGTNYYLKTMLLRDTRFVKPLTAFSLSPEETTISTVLDEISIPIIGINPAASDAHIFVTSSDPNVLSIETAQIRAQSGAEVKAIVRGRGTATITATTFDSGLSASCTITVEKGVDAESINLNKTSLLMGVGGNTEKLIAAVNPSKASQKVIWSSTNENVATVDDKGVVTAVGGGSCKIIATSEDTPSVYASCDVKALSQWCNFLVKCNKDGEAWEDGTQPVFTIQMKDSGEVYPCGGMVPAGNVDILADGVTIYQNYTIQNRPYAYSQSSTLFDYYTIRFEDEDGSLLQTLICIKGKRPAYSGPVLGSENEYIKVTHTGWTPKITYATGAATYKATYSMTEKKHHWDEGVVTTEPGCETKGVKTYTCQNDCCGETYTEDIDPIGHDWDEGVETTAPTCERAGEKTYTCKHDSSHTKTEPITALGHNWDDGTITTEPGCETKGVKTYTCRNDGCGHTYTEDIDPIGHDWDEGVETTAPTCENKGVKTYTCKHDAGHTYTEDIDPIGHDWDEGAQTKDPTCTEAGEYTYTCENDRSHTKTESIKALGHNMTKHQKVEPTCTEAGKEAHWSCDRCGKFYLDEKGTKEVSESALVIPANGHTMTEYAGIPATCTEAGRKAYCVCETCHKLYSDKTGSLEMTEDTLEIPATGHAWDQGVVTTPATCDADGVVTYTCKNDKTHSYTEKIAALGHDWGEWMTTKEPTEVENGEQMRVCTHDASHTETRNIPPIGHIHQMEFVTAKTATCEADGCYVHYHCTSCDLDYKEEEGNTILDVEDLVIPATGHDWNAGEITTPASCESDGVKTFTCQNDHAHTYTEAIKATGHDWNVGEITTPASCESDGVKTYTCQNDHTHTYTEVIKATGHDWDGGVITTPASCESDGVKTYTCQNDTAHTYTEAIKATGHDWNAGVITTPASCESDGVKTYTCQNDPAHTYTEVIKATGHAWGEWYVEKVATPTEAGLLCRVCANDVTHVEYSTIPPLGVSDPVSPDPAVVDPGMVNPPALDPGQTGVSNPDSGYDGDDGDEDWDDDEDDWDEEDWEEAEYLLEEKGYELLDEDEETVSFTGPDDMDVTSFVIPSSVSVAGRTFAVTRIEDGAFSGCGNLTRIVIGKNVEEIGTEAFSGCTKLKTVVIPASVKRIRPKAFFGCKNIRKITIKSTKLSAKTVGSKAFGNTRKNLIIKVPKKVKKTYQKFLKKKGNKKIVIK